MGFNATMVAADLAYVPAEGDLTQVAAFLADRGIVGEAITQGEPVFGWAFSWNPGPHVTGAVWAEPLRVTVFMSMEPTPIGDDSGLLFETRFFVEFIEAADAKDEFIEALQDLIGANLFTRILHY